MRLTADYPPIWLAGFVAGAWGLGRVLPAGPGWLVWPGRALVVLGLLLMAWAAVTMLAARTTVDPHGSPQALVTHGPFRLSRNPIYLGDLLILVGLSLSFGAWIAAPALGWLFARIVTTRFIAPEEARLAQAFPLQFAQFRARTRRWI